MEAGCFTKGQITEYTRSCLRLLFSPWALVWISPWKITYFCLSFIRLWLIILINKSTINPMLLKANCNYKKCIFKQTSRQNTQTHTHTMQSNRRISQLQSRAAFRYTKRKRTNSGRSLTFENTNKPICRSLIRPVSVKKSAGCLNGHVRSGPHYAP